MARRSGLGKLVFKAVKSSIKEAERASKQAARLAEKERKRQERETYKILKKQQREKDKAKQVKAKDKINEQKKHDKYVFNNLTQETIELFKLGKIKENHQKANVSSKIDKEIEIIVSEHGDCHFVSNKVIKISDIDQMLLNGKFNSVLGPDGFKYFKSEIKKIIESVNKKTHKDNFINLDDFFEVLLHSGVYYEFEYIPEDMKAIDESIGWLTAYRFISKNFRKISYKEFRTLVKDIQKTGGNTIEFDEKDKESNLYKIVTESNLFESSSEAKDILATLSLKEIREFCSVHGLTTKRSKDETISTLIQCENTKKLIEKEFRHKSEGLVLAIKDYDLVKGEDIVQLDKFLRDISKHIRNDLFEFVNDKQKYKLVG